MQYVYTYYTVICLRMNVRTYVHRYVRTQVVCTYGRKVCTAAAGLQAAHL